MAVDSEPLEHVVIRRTPELDAEILLAHQKYVAGYGICGLTNLLHDNSHDADYRYIAALVKLLHEQQDALVNPEAHPEVHNPRRQCALYYHLVAVIVEEGAGTEAVATNYTEGFINRLHNPDNLTKSELGDALRRINAADRRLRPRSTASHVH